jgi:hypothetical protein
VLLAAPAALHPFPFSLQYKTRRLAGYFCFRFFGGLGGGFTLRKSDTASSNRIGNRNFLLPDFFCAMQCP